MYDVFAQIRTEGHDEGFDEGFSDGQTSGKNLILALAQHLFDTGRVDDLRRASTDSDYLQQLLVEQGLVQA